jgi:citrate lyase beta subunit
MVEKAVNNLSSSCDGFIFDCEDAVGKDFKQQARDGASVAVNKLRENKHHQSVGCVRINGTNTEYFQDDLKFVRELKPEAILLPKCETVEELQFLRSNVGDTPQLWAMIETPLGVLNVKDIAKKIQVLVFGQVDLANELGCSTDFKTNQRFPLMTSLQMCVLAAKAARIQCLDGVFVDLQDTQNTFEKECEQGLSFGFDGKTLIHPKQIEICNKVFSPTKEQISHAEKIVSAYEKSSGGAISIEGKLVEELHIRKALKTIDFARNIQKRS